MLKRIPNILTCLRLLLIPVFVILLISPTVVRIQIALVVFIFAAGTDLLDGILARKFQAVSNFGKLVDPLADKLLVMSALVMLTSYHDQNSSLPLVPGWLVVLILAREIWITGIRSVAASNGLVLAAKNSGKVKSFLQMLAIVFLLIPYQNSSIYFDFHLLGLLMLKISVFFSYFGAIDYTYTVLLQYPHKIN
jgi:CDP-diacylglycerol---glycerol-3-phosphate 3-phosphatidyltransferase